ncbi:MAG: GAF domain-containing protein [Deltaproteobacteria bacterium]|nr:GAF domain-containing protein [Deltaproteobacteria bacterium]MDQ3297332.1 GAF domain-containing protein [Myxococcota bacterium]
MESVAFTESDKATRYRELLPQLASLIADEPDLVANLANTTAALRACLPIASWVGFYVRKGNELVLGPFQGHVACVRIALGKGVCGTAASERRTLVVPDVDKFPGHIACDAGSRSEIVVPILRGTIGREPDENDVVAVLDLDSYELAAFDDVDAAGLAPIAELLGGLQW